MSNPLRILVLGIFVTALGGIARSQVVTGSIAGRVADASGAVIAQATIQVQNVETGLLRTGAADASGRYVVANLPPGTYSVTAQYPGFRSEVRRPIVLTVGSEAIANFDLAVGAVEESVEVVGAAPLVETTTAAVSGLVGQQEIRQLPLNGRSFDQLALLTSGVMAQPLGSRNQIQGGGVALSGGGARRDANSYLLDGTNTNDASGQGPGGASGNSLGVESIREFRVLVHNFSAEYGAKGGMVLSAVTRSGTNEFHGSAYEFLRNNVLDARDFFNPNELPPFRRNQFGASLGGPLIRDRLFFFANYEGLRERLGTTSIITVLDAEGRQGRLRSATTGAITQVNVNPAVKPYLDLFPLPNQTNFGNSTGEYVVDLRNRTSEDYSMSRMDFNVSNQDNFYWRYVFNPSEAINPIAISPFFAGNGRTVHYAVLSETHIFSPTTLNESRFAFNRSVPEQLGGPIHEHPELDFIPGEGFGNITVTGLAVLGASGSAPRYFLTNVFQVTNTTSFLKGKQNWKVGFDLQREQMNLNSAQERRGNWRFSNVSNFLQAIARDFRGQLIGNVGATEYSVHRGWRRTKFAWFVQDDVQLARNLTVNLGLRHEFWTAPSEVNGRSGNLRDIVNDVQSTRGAPFALKKALFAPRIGLAWDPTGTGKTSIRAGSGLFYNHLDGRNWYLASGDDSCCRARFTLTNNLVFPHPPANLSASFDPGIRVQNQVQFETETPTIVHYTLEIQRQLANSLSLRVGYLGSYAYHMHVDTQQNIAVARTLPDGSPFFDAGAPRRNPRFAEIEQIVFPAHANYNSLQIELQKPFSGDLQLKVFYQLGKNLSDADSVSRSQVGNTAGTMLDIFDIGRDYGRSAYDQRHSFTLSASYQFPFQRHLRSAVARAFLGGWSVNSIFGYGSGFPFNIQVPFNQSRSLNPDLEERPSLAAGASNDPTSGVTKGCPGIPSGEQLQTPERWFDPCAFELQIPGTYGNLGRNTVSGPNFKNLDLSFVKQTKLLGERANLELRAESFNLLNSVNFGLPSGGVFGLAPIAQHLPTSGRITNTLTPGRQIQFGLRLTF
jgi:hypothetical protein